MNLNRILIIFNPKAGKRYPADYQQKFLNQLKRYLPDVSADWLETTENLTRQLEKINFQNYQRLIIIGGDGTVKKTADFLLNNKVDLPLAIIPQGSANVLASSLNIPLVNDQAIKTAALGKEKRIDVGLLNKKHYFFICLAVGFWSRVVNETGQGLKIKLGFLAYLATFFRQKIKQTAFNLKIDGQPLLITGNTLVIANALSLFKLKPKRKIDFSDGLFDVMVAQNKTGWGFLIIGILSLFKRQFLPRLFLTQAKKIVVELTGEQQKTVQLDGELIEVKQIEAEIKAKKLKVVVP